MKITSVVGLASLCVIASSLLRAQTNFDSGSNGSYGSLIVTSNTVLDLPPDGKFHCITILITNNATLSFRRNALNTPVYLLATGDVTIIENAKIDVSGQSPTFGKGGEGGPGGFDGGTPANGQGEQPGDGLGPGAGKGSSASTGSGGAGAYGTPRPPGTYALDGQPYGSTLMSPLIGGSGGGGWIGSSFAGGGGGGGAILIASNTRISLLGSYNSLIVARGGQANQHGFGSGGAVRLVAPEVRAPGLAVVDVSSSASDGTTVGGGGRVRVDAPIRFDLFLNVRGGDYTIGKYMHVFPTNSSRLDIIQAAGTNIVEGFPSPVVVQLPLGAPTNQTVTVQARDFTGVVPITVAVTPDAGPSTRYDTQIDMAGGNVASADVPVAIPVGTTCRIYAWTR